MMILKRTSKLRLKKPVTTTKKKLMVTHPKTATLPKTVKSKLKKKLSTKIPRQFP